MTTLAVAEIFGPTFQGEGPSAGQLAWFLRLGGCNLACSWCDTPYTWDGTRFDLRAEIGRMSVREVARRIAGSGLLVITGGEPLLQAGPLAALLDLVSPHRPVEVETNGTLPPPMWAAGIGWNVSPKLAHSGRVSVLHPGWHDVPDVRFKFVVRSPADLDAVADYGTPPEHTWVMPEGVTEADVLGTAREIAAPVLAHGWNLSLRQHVLLWGAERGR